MKKTQYLISIFTSTEGELYKRHGLCNNYTEGTSRMKQTLFTRENLVYNLHRNNNPGFQ